MDNPPIDTSKCPLCGGPNQCAMAADPSASECWCEDKKFPRELLAQIPEQALRRACICPNCLERVLKTKRNIDPPQ